MVAVIRLLPLTAALSFCGCAGAQKPMLEVVEQLRVATDGAVKLTLQACKPIVEICKVQKSIEHQPDGWRCPALTACHQLQTESAKVVTALQRAVAAAAEVPR